MSVAFRRESDDEHKEPKFELPIPPGPNLVTERGLVLLRERVAALEAEIAATEKEETRQALKRDLRYWLTRLATARLAPAPAYGEAGIGSRVRIRLAGAVREIAIVGGDEADPATNRIAFSAPLARALMGAEEGERVDFNGTSEAIEILAIDNEVAS